MSGSGCNYRLQLGILYKQIVFLSYIAHDGKIFKFQSVTRVASQINTPGKSSPTSKPHELWVDKKQKEIPK